MSTEFQSKWCVLCWRSLGWWPARHQSWIILVRLGNTHLPCGYQGTPYM